MPRKRDLTGLKGTWYSCPAHGLVDDALVLGAIPYCPMPECLEAVTLHRSAGEDRCPDAYNVWHTERNIERMKRRKRRKAKA